MSCLPIVSDSCDRREQVFRVGAAAPRVFNSKYLFLCFLCWQFLNPISVTSDIYVHYNSKNSKSMTYMQM